MPRASLVVRPTRTRRRGKKWSPVMVEIATNTQVGPSATVAEAQDLCANSGSTAQAPTATVIKTGNFKVSFDCASTSTNPVLAAVYIMFIPQAVEVSQLLPIRHPEWIMNWRTFDLTSNQQAVTIQSRLKRNLNSGDKVIVLFRFINISNTDIQVAIRGYASYVCCNN